MTSATSTCASATKLRPDLQGEFTLPEPVKESPAAAQPAKNGAAAAGGMENVAYQGEPGANSQEAIFQHFGARVNTLACHSFEDIFHAVEEGRATLGLLPVENSQAGSIDQAYRPAARPRLARGRGSESVRIMPAVPGTKIEEVVLVRGSSAALAEWTAIRKTRGRWKPCRHTTLLVRPPQLAANPEPGTAVIASAAGRARRRSGALDADIERPAEKHDAFCWASRKRRRASATRP